MTRWIALLLAVLGFAGVDRAYAQEVGSEPGAVVVTIIPAGATFFTEGKTTNGPSFGNYDLGGGATVNFNRYVGVEGEVSGSLGVSQQLAFAGQTLTQTTPHFLNYSGNLIVQSPTRSGVSPYVTGGIGGMTLFEKAELGINSTETFLTSNVGGGVNWYSGRWGLRADYRFIAVQSKDNAPAFFGAETRYGHRIYGGLLVNIGRR
jgi:hypothetical protein